MIDYCKSDVALLKTGCQAFRQEFQTQAGFNPMAKSMTIASACNLYRRKHHLRQHLVEIKTGIRRVAQLVPDRGPETRIYSSLPEA